MTYYNQKKLMCVCVPVIVMQVCAVVVWCGSAVQCCCHFQGGSSGAGPPQTSPLSRGGAGVWSVIEGGVVVEGGGVGEGGGPGV